MKALYCRYWIARAQREHYNCTAARQSRGTRRREHQLPARDRSRTRTNINKTSVANLQKTILGLKIFLKAVVLLSCVISRTITNIFDSNHSFFNSYMNVHGFIYYRMLN